MTELEAYAALRDDITGIEVRGHTTPRSGGALIVNHTQPGPYERIWRSDCLIPADIKLELLAAVASLESVPGSQKDWHPTSNGKVLDLVHPSLYPVVYGRSISMTGELLKPREDNTVDPRFFFLVGRCAQRRSVFWSTKSPVAHPLAVWGIETPSQRCM